jgi:hypothetical protein
VLRPINLADIRLGAGTQIRAGVTEEVASEYCRRMLAGDAFLAVEAFLGGTGSRLKGLETIHRPGGLIPGQLEDWRLPVEVGRIIQPASNI